MLGDLFGWGAGVGVTVKLGEEGLNYGITNYGLKINICKIIP